MSEKLNHIERPPLPWRRRRQTECGMTLHDADPVFQRADAAAMVKRLGVQRAAFVLCMNCAHSADRWPTWDDDPVLRMERETYGGRRPADELRGELRALAALVNAHRDEFDALVLDVQEAPVLSDARRARRVRS